MCESVVMIVCLDVDECLGGGPRDVLCQRGTLRWSSEGSECVTVVVIVCLDVDECMEGPGDVLCQRGTL